MKNRIILFDIDFTLFNAKLYRDAFVSRLKEELGYIGDNFDLLAEESYKASKKRVGYFDPEIFIEELLNITKISKDKKKLTEIIFDQNLISNYLYSDSKDILGKISKLNNIKIGIFSAGKILLQKPKIKDVEDFFHKEHIHIFEYNKNKALPKLINDYKNYELYIVDDIQSILAEAKRLNVNIITIWIQRKGYSKNLNPVANFAPDYIISSLDEVINILKK